VLSIIVVGMGAAIGREAALKQAGGLAGDKISGWLGLTPEQRKLLVACGAGAGMAAAYNVPFGGALFTLEVLLGTVSIATVLPAFVTSFLATAVSWSMLPNEPTYQLPSFPATRSLLMWALLCGPLMGYGAVWFVRGLRWAKDQRPKGWAVVAMPIVVFVALGFAAVKFPQLLGNGKNVVQLAFDARLGVGLLVWLLFLRPLATIAVLRSGCDVQRRVNPRVLESRYADLRAAGNGSGAGRGDTGADFVGSVHARADLQREHVDGSFADSGCRGDVYVFPVREANVLLEHFQFKCLHTRTT
jgi:H+/Cl- antiporter ClcA